MEGELITRAWHHKTDVREDAGLPRIDRGGIRCDRPRRRARLNAAGLDNAAAPGSSWPTVPALANNYSSKAWRLPIGRAIRSNVELADADKPSIIVDRMLFLR